MISSLFYEKEKNTTLLDIVNKCKRDACTQSTPCASCTRTSTADFNKKKKNKDTWMKVCLYRVFYIENHILLYFCTLAHVFAKNDLL